MKTHPSVLRTRAFASATAGALAAAALVGCGTPPGATIAAAPALGPAPVIVRADVHQEADAMRVSTLDAQRLDRATFGVDALALQQVGRLGWARWVDDQLHPKPFALPESVSERIVQMKIVREPLVARLREDVTAKKSADTVADDEQKKAAQQAYQKGLNTQADEAAQRWLLLAANSPNQVQERLVWFWVNHFSIAQGKANLRLFAGDYEATLRAHALGKFRDLLEASAMHPAMLRYLDNERNAAGQINENYARELMELHTLGVDGGYTQQDVTELARILTGWTMRPQQPMRRRFADPMDAPAGGHGDSIFLFDPARHDGGTKTWLGRRIAPDGQLEGEFALDVLAKHPSTARHIAFKLARRFVADDPPPALVERLARRFLDTDGDLRAVMQALADSPEFRDPAPTKFKTPYQYVLSAVRATGIVTTNVRPLMGQLAQLGQPLYGCQTPDGWHDTEADWLNPNAITQRVNFATALAAGKLPLQRVDDPGAPAGNDGLKAMERQTERAMNGGQPVEGSTPPVDAATLLATLGPAISDKTRRAVENTPPELRAALVLGSPDFMRR